MRYQVKLGRREVRVDPRTLRLSAYLTPALPAPPPERDWLAAFTGDWQMFMNDRLGCCTCAGVAHQVMLWAANSGIAIPAFTDANVLDIYERWCGYQDGDPSTDNGGIELDILNDWRQQGFCGRQLLAYADVAVRNETQVRQAIDLFGGLYIGFQVPSFVMDIADDPAKVWDVVEDDGGIEGGHCIVIGGYLANGNRTFVSWGKRYEMTQAFWDKYVDEAHALLSPDWIESNGGAPSGFNLDQLKADLAAIR